MTMTKFIVILDKGFSKTCKPPWKRMLGFEPSNVANSNYIVLENDLYKHVTN